MVISLSFFISVTEMDMGEVHNTFFDEYDTYVKAEHVSIDHSVATQHEHKIYALIYCLFNHYKGLNNQSENRNHHRFAYCNHYPPKLFLRNAVWRI
ncbi:MAG: hypothetical protein WKF91_20425 [Segetibacter sp.]